MKTTPPLSIQEILQVKVYKIYEISEIKPTFESNKFFIN